MRKWILASGAIAIVCASIGVETGRGQGVGGGGSSGVTNVNVSNDPVPVDLPGTANDPFKAGAMTRGVLNAVTISQPKNFSSEARESQTQIRQLTQKLRDASDDASKADLTKQLESAVGKYFDEDMKVRESQLSQLEERVTKLRAQLDRRRKAKDEITKLQTQVMVNDADGLGFADLPVERSGTFTLEPATFNVTAPPPSTSPYLNFQAFPATPGVPQLPAPAPTPAPARR